MVDDDRQQAALLRVAGQTLDGTVRRPRLRRLARHVRHPIAPDEPIAHPLAVLRFLGVDAEPLELDEGACAECSAELPEPEAGRWRRGVLCDPRDKHFERELTAYLGFVAVCRVD